MTTCTKAHALNVVRRAYGPVYAEFLAERLPDRIDFHDPAHASLVLEFGLSLDDLFNALGAEL